MTMLDSMRNLQEKQALPSPLNPGQEHELVEM